MMAENRFRWPAKLSLFPVRQAAVLICKRSHLQTLPIKEIAKR